MAEPECRLPLWRLSHRGSKLALPVADRHYNRRKPGSPQFVPPGACLVLRTPVCDAVWVTSWPLPQYVRHAWPGAWVCSCFRNEGPQRASELIRQAVAATLAFWPDVPPPGMVTFVDRGKVRPTAVRGKNVWGWTFRKAGFVDCGETEGGLLALRLWPAAMPAPSAPVGAQRLLLGGVCRG